MAFDIANFAPAGNTSRPPSGIGTSTLVGAPRLFTYMSADTIATMNSSGYFNAGTAYKGAYQLLEKGDLIFALGGAGSGGTLAPAILMVLSKASGVLDVSDGTTITISDTD